MAVEEPTRSRFWKGNDSSEEEDQESTEEEEEEDPQPKKKPTSSRWADVDSDDDYNKKRVLKSANLKTTEAVGKSLRNLKQLISINDWNNAEEEYKKLLKEGAKAKKADRENPDVEVPAFVHSIAFLNEKIQELFANKPVLKKLSKTNGKSFNHMRARVSKLFAELGAQHDMKTALESTVGFEDDQDDQDSDTESESDSESSDSDSDSDSDSSSDGSSSGDDDDGSDSDSDSDSSEDWSSDSSESYISDVDVSGAVGRTRWLKTTKSTVKDLKQKGDDDVKAKQRDDEKRARAVIKRQAERLAAEKRATEKGTVSSAKLLTPKQINDKFKALITLRGKKGANKVDIVSKMQKLAFMQVTQSPAKAIPIFMHVISAQLDVRLGADGYMSRALWHSVCQNVRYVLKLLQENPNFRLHALSTGSLGPSVDSGTQDGHAEDGKVAIESTEDDEALEMDGDLIILRVAGDLSFCVDRLANDYMKCLRLTPQHTREYVDRLADESDLVDLALQSLDYYINIQVKEKATKMCLICVEFTYYKHSNVALALLREQALIHKFGKREFFHLACSGAAETEEGIRAAQDFSVSHPAAACGSPSYLAQNADIGYDPMTKIGEWCTFMYQYGDAREKIRALICQIYHYAIHDEFFKARDLLLMSRLQDQIHTVEIDTQILLNRMLVQLAFAAFRAERMEDSHGCLLEVCGNNREKELLAQGLSWRLNRSPEQEVTEKRRLMPYHQHINLELLNAVFLTTAMLLEIPLMAATEFENKHIVLNRNFRRQYRQYVDNCCGPPENTKEHIFAAALAISQGDWQKATTLVTELPIWDLFLDGNRVREMLAKRIKEESLRTYMFAFSAHYDSIKQDYLCDMFQMEPERVHSLVSKMILNEEILARWDQPTASVELQAREPTHVQALALQYAERLSSVLDSNERALHFGGFEERGPRNRHDREGGKYSGYRDGGHKSGRGAGISRGHRGDKNHPRSFGPGGDSRYGFSSRKQK